MMFLGEGFFEKSPSPNPSSKTFIQIDWMKFVQNDGKIGMLYT